MHTNIANKKYTLLHFYTSINWLFLHKLWIILYSVCWEISAGICKFYICTVATGTDGFVRDLRIIIKDLFQMYGCWMETRAWQTGKYVIVTFTSMKHCIFPQSLLTQSFSWKYGKRSHILYENPRALSILDKECWWVFNEFIVLQENNNITNLEGCHQD